MLYRCYGSPYINGGQVIKEEQLGASGTGLFSDDVACDIRDDYRELIGDGLAGPAATDRLLRKWADALDDPDEGPVIWLALAATQWRTGRLEDRVRERAEEVIRSGRDVLRWDTESDRRARARVLAKLQSDLDSPQRHPVKVRPRLRTTTPLRPGDAITYRLTDERLVLLRVVFRVGDDNDNYPIVEVADWVGLSSPAAPGSLQTRSFHAGVEMLSLVQHRRGDYPQDRIDVVARGLAVTRRNPDPSMMLAWPELEAFLLRTQS